MFTTGNDTGIKNDNSETQQNIMNSQNRKNDCNKSKTPFGVVSYRFPNLNTLKLSTLKIFKTGFRLFRTFAPLCHLSA